MKIMTAHTKKKNVTNNTTRRRKSTGPITESGKNRSSKNALTYGATSPKLLNEAEQER